MPRLVFIGVIAAVVFTVFSVIDCAVQPPTRHRGVSKPFWIIITLVPVIGGILWFAIGRTRGSASSFVVPDRPDDDPDFLRGARESAADERIRRLEEELRRLDDEDAPGDPERKRGGNGDGTPGLPDARG